MKGIPKFLLNTLTTGAKAAKDHPKIAIGATVATGAALVAMKSVFSAPDEYGSADNGYMSGSKDGSGNGKEIIPTQVLNTRIPLLSPLAARANNGLNWGMRTANGLTGGTLFPEAGRPKWAVKAGLNSANGDIGQTIANNRFDSAFASGRIGDVIGQELSPEEEAMLAHLPAKDRNRYKVQKRLQEQAQMMGLLSQIQALKHQMAMQVIQNIR
jgi:hypothetical protein